MKRPLKVLLISFLTVLGLYATFMLIYFPTSEPSFCRSCHFIEPYVTSWEKKSHQEVKCLFCHEQRGFLGKIDSKSRGLNYVYQTATNQAASILIEAKIFEQNCVSCHLGDNKQYSQAPHLDPKHMDYIQQDQSCLECHRDVGHTVNIKIK